MRKPMAFPVRFVAEGQIVQTTSRDLDEDSVFVRCVEPPEVGEKIVLRLYLPGMAVADAVHGEVAKADEDGFRARFIDLPAEALVHIEKALRSGGALSHDPDEPAPYRSDRRSSPRFLARFRVSLGSGAHQALNLSATGMFIQAEQPPGLDEIVQVVLELPDGKPPLESQAIVLHRVVEGGGPIAGAGVQFIGAGDAFRARVDAYLGTLQEK